MAAIDPVAEQKTTLADLKLQEGQTFGKIGEEEGFLKSNYGTINSVTGQAEGGTFGNELTRQETERGNPFQIEANRANKGGIMTSGANQGRKATIAGNFAGKRIANTARVTQGLAGFKRGREGAETTYTIGAHGAAATKTRNEDINQANNPTVAPVPYSNPASPPPAPVANLKTGAPGPGYVWSPWSNRWVGQARYNAEKIKGVRS